MTGADLSAAVKPDIPILDYRAQLARILSSADFEATAREHDFLRYVVEETLSGRGERIKAYSIAVEVFGRDASFDPQIDPIVRIEAGHLRRSLERYYLTAGKADPILICVPKGGYVPTFLSQSASQISEATTSALPTTSPKMGPSRWRRHVIVWPAMAFLALTAVGALSFFWPNLLRIGGSPSMPEIPRLLIEPFEDLSGTSTAIASGLTQEIVSQISKFKDIVVVVAPARPESPPRFVLAGSVDPSADVFRLRVRLVNQADGSVLWANSYDGGMKVADLRKAQADVARNVATSLAQTYGVIFQADATLHVDNPPDDWTAYSCTLAYYAYRVDLDPKDLPSVRNCLEEAVERFPRYATAWGLLSQTYIDEMRFSYPMDPARSSALIGRALVAARKAVELDPLNIRGLQAEMFALYFSKEFDAAMAVGKQAMALNPNDTELMGEYGYRLALSGNWDEGCPLVTEARERNPGPLAYYESALALCAYFRGDYPLAVMWLRKTTAPRNPLYHAVAAAIYGQGGYPLEASQERVWLEKNTPTFLQNLRSEASFRFGRPEDVKFFIGSMRKAGVNVED